MIKQGKGGKIIGACSTAGFRPVCAVGIVLSNCCSLIIIFQSENTVAYSTSTWAVRGMTQAAALEFAPYNINVSVPFGTGLS